MCQSESCTICGNTERKLQLHHIIKRRHGGGDEKENCVYLCPTCHRLVDMRKIGNVGKYWLSKIGFTESEFWNKVNEMEKKPKV